MVTVSQLSKWLDETRSAKVLSVYVAPRTTNPADRFGWRSKLERRLTEIGLDLRANNPSEEPHFQTAALALRQAMADLDLSDAPGFVAFVRGGRVLCAEITSGATPDAVIWGDGIQVAPLLAASTTDDAVIGAIVSSRGARIYKYDHRSLKEIDKVHVGHHEGQFYHMGSEPRQGFHSGTRGETGSDAAQRAQHSALLHMVRNLAERLEKLSRPRTPVVIGGTPASAREAFDALAASVQQRGLVAPDLTVSAEPRVIGRALVDGARSIRSEAQLTILYEATNLAEAHGKAAVGAQPIREALSVNAVHHLLISPTFIASHGDEAEELVRSALSERAEITVAEGAAVEELDRHGGVTAQLRFVPAAVV